MEDLIRATFPLTPKGIIDHLKLLRRSTRRPPRSDILAVPTIRSHMGKDGQSRRSGQCGGQVCRSRPLAGSSRANVRTPGGSPARGSASADPTKSPIILRWMPFLLAAVLAALVYCVMHGLWLWALPCCWPPPQPTWFGRKAAGSISRRRRLLSAVEAGVAYFITDAPVRAALADGGRGRSVEGDAGPD